MKHRKSIFQTIFEELSGFQPKPDEFFQLREEADEGQLDQSLAPNQSPKPQGAGQPEQGQQPGRQKTNNEGQDQPQQNQPNQKGEKDQPGQKEVKGQKNLAEDQKKQNDKGKFKPLKKPQKLAERLGEAKPMSELEIFSDLDSNRQVIGGLFHLDVNKDVIIREFALGTPEQNRALLIFLEGMVDKNTINNSILQPLMLLAGLDKEKEPADRLGVCRKVVERYLPANQVRVIDKFQDMIGEVTSGSTALFVDGCRHCIAAETKGYEFRQVESARNEQVVQGPQEGFTENLQVNTSQIRRILQTPDLVTELVTVGRRSRTSVAIMYIQGIAPLPLVREVKRRISQVKVDYVAESGMLEEFIEDHTFSLFPQVMKTERPDQVAAMLAEGRVAMVIGGNPYVLVAPVTFWDFIQNPEDYYIRFADGIWLRVIRVVAMFLTLLLPAFYLAIATYHQEMIPTDLLLAIAGTKERVPFPTIIEVLLMELSFELIREAGIRVPGLIGPTLGIVGTLILGQAAVAANIVSPILIIIVAVTGLASFTIPNYAVSFAFRIMRFFFIIMSYMFGFIGISVGLVQMLFFITSMRSFGVPFFAPVAPRMSSSGDLVMRLPLWMEETRPDFLQPQDVRRQPPISRAWVKKGPGSQKDGGRQK